MCSSDPMVRSIATQETLKETKFQRLAFHLVEEVVEVGKTCRPWCHEDHHLCFGESSGSRERSPTNTLCRSECLEPNSVELPGYSSRSVVHHSTVPPWALLQVCIEVTHRHTPTQRQLASVGKKPSSTCQLCPERQSLHHILTYCNTTGEEEVQWEAWRHPGFSTSFLPWSQDTG